MRRTILSAVAMLVVAGFYFGTVYFRTLGAQQQEESKQEPFPLVRVPITPDEFPVSQSVKDYVELRRLETLRYKGTKMIPSRSAPADQLALQEEISAVFNAQDPQPPVRAQQFAAWLNHATYKVVLWRGEITKLEVSPDGGATVTLVIAISIASPDVGITFTFDHAIETWQYKDGKLTFVESEAHVTGKWAFIG